jgi:DNA-binding NarL/FixJ family response regulator
VTKPVLVVDDHRTFAELMRLGLNAQPDFECSAVAHTAAEARCVAATVPFAAAIVDLGLPDGDGAALVGDLHRLAPEARIVVLTAHPRSDLARRALAAGARRVLPKQGSLGDVLDALREDGLAPVPPAADDVLSPREREVLALLAEGVDARGIAHRLGLSTYTVRDHIRSILAKLGVHTQLEAVVAAAHAGILLVEPK